MSDTDIRMSYRSGLPYFTKEFHSKTNLCDIHESNEEVYKTWSLYSFVLSMFPESNEPILACETDEEGTGLLLCNAHNQNDSSTCPVEIIRKGVIKNALRRNVFDNFTSFDLPESCYDSRYRNTLLPDKVKIDDEQEERREYCFVLSKYQIPKNRYSYMLENFFNKYLVELNDKTCRSLNPGITQHRLGLIASPQKLVNINYTAKEREMEENRKMMFISNTATNRINIALENGLVKRCLKHKKIKIDPVLMPTDVTLCEISGYFFYMFNRPLSDFCSYAYKRNQVRYFKYMTNHLVSATIIGSSVMCMYIEGEDDLTMDFFRPLPIVNARYYTACAILSFACVYPPDDEERWKKYAVCTSFSDLSSYLNETNTDINITKGMFECKKVAGGKPFQPYVVTQLPFIVECSRTISSFTRYLNSDDGWVDIQEENVQVYTQVKLFVSQSIQVYNFAVKDEYLNRSMIMLGNPKNQSSVLGDFNTLNLDVYVSRMKDGVTTEGWTKYSEGGTWIPNDFAYLTNFSMSPTDFVIEDNIEERVNGNQSLVNSLYLIRSQEIVQKLK